MGTLEYEFINHSIDAHRAAHQLKFSVCGVVEDEVVPVEIGEVRPTHAASERGNMVDLPPSAWLMVQAGIPT